MSSRDRRATAGLRMSSLVGQALQDDAAFWAHDTWAEDSESYSEESVADEFDSDFDSNDSDDDVSDDENAQVAADEDEQIDAKRQKRTAAGVYLDSAAAVIRNKKKQKGTSIAGAGFNKGIKLNVPQPPGHLFQPNRNQLTSQVPTPMTATPQQNTSGTGAVVQFPTEITSTQQQQQSTSIKTEPTKSSSPAKPTLSATTRAAAGARRNRRTRAAISNEPSKTTRRHQEQQQRATTPKQKQHYSQEQLLLEAATVTEGENAKWLLARKRLQETLDKEYKSTLLTVSAGTKLVSSFVSRRGQLNTITFHESVPFLHIKSKPTQTENTAAPVCIITGLPAKYRDPVTRQPYATVAAYKELKRRQQQQQKQHLATEKNDKDDDVITTTTEQPNKATIPFQQANAFAQPSNGSMNVASLSGSSQLLGIRHNQKEPPADAINKLVPLPTPTTTTDELAIIVASAETKVAPPLQMPSPVDHSTTTTMQQPTSPLPSARDCMINNNAHSIIPDETTHSVQSSSTSAPASPTARHSPRKCKPSARVLLNDTCKGKQ
jgi:hypothetical protein